MFANFLPAAVQALTEPTSIALAQSITQQAIATSLLPTPIATAYVHQAAPDAANSPILLLPGFDSSILEFRRLLPLLAPAQPTWAIDLLGFGFTDRPPTAPYTPAAIKTHLYAAWQTLIGKPVILVGASMGGAAAIDFALTYPDAVAKLVLLDSAGFAAGPAIGRFLVPPLGYLATEFLRQPQVRRQVSFNAYTDPRMVTPDAELCGALHLQSPAWRAALIAFTKSGGYNFLADLIPKITAPTLIIWGDNDKILGTQDATRFHQAIAASHLVWIPQCGHVPHLEKPQETAAAILQFVAASGR
jgi:pimeloyl-ACP methyl ester carboxylesterase